MKQNSKAGDIFNKYKKTKKKITAIPSNRAYGTPMKVPKAMQTSKNPSWVKQKSKRMCKTCGK